MQSVKPDEASAPEAPAEEAFAEIPLLPFTARQVRPGRRRRTLIAAALVGSVVIGLLVAYLTRPAEVDPNAPRVVAEVTGMHCPVQCGLRVAATLEQLPFVVPGSVTANPQTGSVTFALTSAEAADQDQIRRAVERAGFGVRSVRMPEVPPR
jgi:hypothetical protein